MRFCSEKRPVLVGVASGAITQDVRRRLNDCLSDHHLTCPSNTDAPLPSPVIDVDATDNATRLSLHNTESGQCGQYVALSYCCK